jgi:deoxyribodipyrimidine photo-lyase
MPVESERISKLNSAPERGTGKYVLYWAQMNRRVDANHDLLHAIEIANRYKSPVLYYEGLTCSYEYANDRLHTFILEGVPETAKRLQKAGIGYIFYLRPTKNAPNNVFYELARNAAAVVTDDYPTFIARHHNSRVPGKLDVAFYAVDSSCIVPMRRIEKREYAAYTIRPKIKRLLPEYFKPVEKVHVKRRFDLQIPNFHTEVHEDTIAELVDSCDIDHTVAPSLTFRGGRLAAERRLQHFLRHNLKRYAKDRNQPSEHATSEMSPYLHFGQISSLEIALAVRDYALNHKLISHEYLEELIVRRELAFNYASHVEEPEKLENLPEWCQEDMGKHAHDKRDPIYTRKQLESAETHNELWNATQKEMLLRGKIHGYYPIYWGKKIIEWSPTYQEALDTMIYIHGRYALDGRDPNTFTNILWCFGLHDRPWYERPIFGRMRYMSHEGMKRKTNIGAYIDEIEQLEKTGKDVHRIV